MTAGTDLDPGATARHHIANLLYGYVDTADRKDVEAVVQQLGDSDVHFPFGSASTPTAVRELFARLWSSPTAHRHDVTNLVVTARGPDTGVWLARAHYTRWIFEPEPTLHTLGEYELVVDGSDWSITTLTVTRTWMKE